MQLKIIFFMQYSSELQGPKCTRKSAFRKAHTRLQLFKTRAKEAH